MLISTCYYAIKDKRREIVSMTQTMKDKDNAAQRKGRPGQRQQERLERLARRRRRRQIIISASVAVALIALSALGVWEYQQVMTQQQAAAQKLKDQHATATAKVVAPTQTAATNATATAAPRVTATALAHAVQTASSGSPTPAAGPTSPPAVSGTPVTTSDGLKYLDIKEGTGATVQQGSNVQVEYTGWIAKTGKKFDSSYDHGGQSFPLANVGQAQVIQGWNEGLIGMKAGGTRRLYIPASLGYGAQGSPPVIPANADLIFDVTILTVQ
jgi:FKBP-type peptidyl-prolyl cis-trans isomerase